MVISEIDFWNNIKNYDKEINSVLIYDNLLVKELKKISNKKKKIIADFGCGIGNSLKYIQEFKKIYAIDFSKNMLETLKNNNNNNLKNINFLKNDIKKVKLNEKVDIILAINSIFPKNYSEFDEYINNILNNLKEKGEILLLLPSFEAYTYYLQMLSIIKFNKTKNPNLVKTEMEEIFKNRNYNAFGYIINQNGIMQKKWLKEEILFRLKKYNFKNLTIKKMETELKNNLINEKNTKFKNWYWMIKIN